MLGRGSQHLHSVRESASGVGARCPCDGTSKSGIQESDRVASVLEALPGVPIADGVEDLLAGRMPGPVKDISRRDM
jgi:hypothetical protein